MNLAPFRFDGKRGALFCVSALDAFASDLHGHVKDVPRNKVSSGVIRTEQTGKPFIQCDVDFPAPTGPSTGEFQAYQRDGERGVPEI